MAAKHPTAIPEKSLAKPSWKYVLTFWLSVAITVLSGFLLAQAYLNHVTFLNEGDKVADWAEVFNAEKMYGNYVAGIEKMTTDLTGGYISTAELRGYYKLVNDFYYTGEIITGEEFGGYL